mgnify:CR=1 FL=1
MNLIALISCFCLPSIWAHATPQRVITTSPTLTEMLYDLGGESRLVATVEFSDYPEAAKKIPRIGNFFAPSIERTLLYRPDLVLVDGAARNSQYEVALSRLGIAKEVIEKINFAAKNIFFATGSSKLLPKSFKSLNEVAALMATDQTLMMQIDGHTDNTGKAEENLKLSTNRKYICIPS